jgi:hypothetical protein
MGDNIDIVALGSMAPGAIVFPSISREAEKKAPLDVVDFDNCCLDCSDIPPDLTRTQPTFLLFVQTLGLFWFRTEPFLFN